MKKLVIPLVVAINLVVSSAGAQGTGSSAGVTGGDDLVREKGRFEETWVSPDADLGRYDELRFQVAEVRFREVEANPADTSGRIDSMTSEFALSEDEQGRFRQVVAEAIVEELERSKRFRLVDDAGPDTLTVRTSILDIVCRLPPLNIAQVDTHPSVVAEGTLRFDLVDSETGVIQARLEERSRVRPSGRGGYEVSPMPVNRLTMWRDIAQWGRDNGAALRRVLDKAQRGRGLTRHAPVD